LCSKLVYLLLDHLFGESFCIGIKRVVIHARRYG
jgi:hypothetical protein